MTTKTLHRKRSLERLEYWQGQLLRSSDFRAQESAANEFRWWHNRSLHNAYGVSLGLDVSADSTGVLVHCGLAYDITGRELLVPSPAHIIFPRPTKPEPYLLLATYDTGESPRTADFGWMRRSRFDARSGVPLAWVNFDAANKPSLDPTFEPPVSRPLARPHIASGVTPPGGTVWETWSESNPNVADLPQVVGLQTHIDTSAAGFTETPVYIAQLQSAVKPQIHVLPPALCHIAEAQPGSLLFRIWLPRLVRSEISLTVPEAKVSEADATKVNLSKPSDFVAGDVVHKKGAAKSTTIKEISDDKLTLTLEDDLSLKKGSTLRLAQIPDSERLATLLGDLRYFPGMQLLVTGTGLTGAAFFATVNVTLNGSGAVGLTPEIAPLSVGDNAASAPRIFIVSTQTLDLPLIVQNLGWYVCWLGLTSSPRPSLTCEGDACQIPATEAC